jgi:hypothetical protein
LFTILLYCLHFFSKTNNLRLWAIKCRFFSLLLLLLQATEHKRCYFEAADDKHS